MNETAADHLDASNARTYRSAFARHRFSTNVDQGLWPVERACLERVASDRRTSILDLGVGGGRTCAELSRAFGSYIGVDYSAEMVDAARAKFPDLDLRVMDARDLDWESTFDCVVFSYNGLDYIDHEDRRSVQRLIYRALKPGGVFIYSTHNAGSPARKTLMTSMWASSLARPKRFFELLGNRWRNFPKQTSIPGGHYHIVNDPGLLFALLTVYVDIPSEIATLHDIGFAVEAALGADGTVVREYTANDPWVYLAARKPMG